MWRLGGGKLHPLMWEWIGGRDGGGGQLLLLEVLHQDGEDRLELLEQHQGAGHLYLHFLLIFWLLSSVSNWVKIMKKLFMFQLNFCIFFHFTSHNLSFQFIFLIKSMMSLIYKVMRCLWLFRNILTFSGVLASVTSLCLLNLKMKPLLLTFPTRTISFLTLFDQIVRNYPKLPDTVPTKSRG